MYTATVTKLSCRKALFGLALFYQKVNLPVKHIASSKMLRMAASGTGYK